MDLTDAARLARRQVENAGFGNVEVYIKAESLTKAGVNRAAIRQEALNTSAVIRVVVFTRDGVVDIGGR